MLPRLYRLPRTIRLGRTDRLATPFFILKIIPNDLTTSRFAVVVSKKVSKSAVKRNTVRRRLQACFLEQQPSLKKNYDILCIALPSSKDVLSSQLSNAFETALKKKEIIV